MSGLLCFANWAVVSEETDVLHTATHDGFVGGFSKQR